MVEVAVASKVWSAGGVMVGTVVSYIETRCEEVATFPTASVAVHITVVVPTEKRRPDGALLVSEGFESIASERSVTVPSVTAVVVPVASSVMSAGTVKVGAVLSTIKSPPEVEVATIVLPARSCAFPRSTVVVPLPESTVKSKV